MQKATSHETYNPQILKEHEKIKVLKVYIETEGHDKLATQAPEKTDEFEFKDDDEVIQK